MCKVSLTVVLAVEPGNPDAARLIRVRARYFGHGDTFRVLNLTREQTRVLEMFKRRGDCAYTEAA
jgi:hypothetical protein